MKVTFRKLMCLGAAALVAGMMGLTGCKSSGNETTTQKWSDDETAREVKKQLASDPAFKYPNVHANVYQGTVQLSGFVSTPEQRQRAAELASHAKGANKVINAITLEPTPTGPAPIQGTVPGQEQPSPKQ